MMYAHADMSNKEKGEEGVGRKNRKGRCYERRAI
jgi:hypothetical protein